MRSSTAMGPAAARLLQPGALSGVVLGRQLGRTAAGVQFVRFAHIPSEKALKREMQRSVREGSKRTTYESMTKTQRDANNQYFKTGGGPLIPGTFVALPLSQYPRNPYNAVLYQYYRMYQWGLTKLVMLSFKLNSMPTWTSWPLWSAKRQTIRLAAKNMYSDMLASFAAGDKTELHNLCVGNFAKKLCAAVDRRSGNDTTKFEITHDRSLFYPRILSHQIHNIIITDDEWYTEQAIVGLSSTQKLSKHDARTGELVPGSTKVQQKVENVVLTRLVSNKTFKGTPWKIWGTVPATTLDAYLFEQKWMEEQQAQRTGHQPK